jgi:hypothetical protein
MNECEHLLNHGFTFRIVITFLSFYILLLFINKKGVKKYIFLIIPIILLGVEGLDKLPPEKWNWNIIKTFLHYRKCGKTFYYHKNDKMADYISYIVTYLFLALFFENDLLLLFFVVYRIFGVFMFSVTMDSSWLILFFDFVKEYLLYLFLFGKNFNYLLPFISLKILYESLFHTVHNPNHYIKN